MTHSYLESQTMQFTKDTAIMSITPEVANLLVQMGELFTGIASGAIEGIVVHDRQRGLHVIKLLHVDGEGGGALAMHTTIDQTPLTLDQPGQLEMVAQEHPTPRRGRPHSTKEAGKGQAPRVAYKLLRKPTEEDAAALTAMGVVAVKYIHEHAGKEGVTTDALVAALGCATSTAGNIMSQVRKRPGLLKVIKLNRER